MWCIGGTFLMTGNYDGTNDGYRYLHPQPQLHLECCHWLCCIAAHLDKWNSMERSTATTSIVIQRCEKWSSTSQFNRNACNRLQQLLLYTGLHSISFQLTPTQLGSYQFKPDSGGFNWQVTHAQSAWAMDHHVMHDHGMQFYSKALINESELAL